MRHGEGDLLIKQEHGVGLRAGALGENLRVPWVGHAGLAQPFFVERARDNTVGTAGEAFVDRKAEPIIGRLTCGCRNSTGLNLGQICPTRIEAWDVRRKKSRVAYHPRIREPFDLRPGFADDFRADSRHVTESDQQTWAGVHSADPLAQAQRSTFAEGGVAKLGQMMAEPMSEGQQQTVMGDLLELE